ncbi:MULTISPECIES: leucine--tRNA ligase [Butyricimonas]|jgi:leucine--tRNA ligase|uniref:Leucine--tRNA ligase n=1 Tax=Butyricimonas faecihominis TaxID=1472416 RepID=A0A7W6HX99_9BACT|nr:MULTISPECIES: leucine--tRNA ligase [Butyricimonas]OKZ18477.1 MAG: leucine--tRNA ligase [Butyricimonas synergistica]KAB1505376.1 leucine--tRNA ligase [Butyricimonas faecihominis]MBB4026054.1 leucyl-tRNA synthetase [Butyricimonas faecihominis]WOF09730.1 leucine--tRNA ligase [Butyricimonas faecihominis]BEI57954.1 leucine--tRNA ligase [Butyricimonas faecihominis]
MEYNFKEVEKKWQSYWQENKTYRVEVDPSKPKYYVLDMFPYPSGAGLHVGHPLGYIASDIYSRYKHLKGFNVLHPMGYDAYGLPAEQYAIQTGQHPAITTEKNIRRYREQMDKIGFSFDWDREIRTCDPEYYKWTQWTFIQMFNSFYCYDEQKAMPITELVKAFEAVGTQGLNVACGEEMDFTAEEWKNKSTKEQQEILLNYRLAYLADTMVNWCPQLGTVLANDEVKEGLSLRGGYPVVQKKMRQWSLRVSAYAQRLLDGLDNIDWSDSLKDIQRNWIGRSQGADVRFDVKDSDLKLEIFTTRPDTIFGVSFMVLAPESDYVKPLTTPEQADAVAEYLDYVSKRTERERQTEVKKVTGVFTGSYAINPFTNEAIPIWISEYVLSGYGTGAIMAVPGHDSRDYAFAKHFNLPIVPVVDDGEGHDMSEGSYDAKAGKMINSGIINGMEVKEAIAYIAGEVEKRGIGKSKINYRLRDAIFSRQRYWGEPFPVYYKDDLPYMLDESKLPLELPEVDKYLPTESGEPPLGRAKNWKTEDGYPLELNTMPGFAGSSAYFLRYMDPHNNKALVDHEICNYWKNVDLYLGGSEHATGHLIYARFWNMFLYDLGVACEEEPFKKLINQGMIQGRSNFVYRIQGTNTFVSVGLKDQYKTTEIHVDVNIVKNDVLDQDAFRAWMPEYANAEFILENGKYICGWAIEKMSKSMFNVVNPDTIIEEYGADTLRLYEMFLGPLEFSKPWDTQGIDGVYKFLRKFWRLFQVGEDFSVSDETPSREELKVLHKTIKKVEYDIENFSFNTSIPAFMICTNELTALKCNKRAVLEPLVIALAPFAPHMAEELWSLLGHTQSITKESFPKWEEKFLVEDAFEYPVSFNGKVRFKLSMPLTATNADIEAAVKAAPESTKWLEGKEIKKMIIVPKKIVNIVIG